MEFLLMVLGHNFRKMVATTASSLKKVFKTTRSCSTYNYITRF
ncbi:hypothetical protein [Flavobacterium columnare]|nr:hypothetical protein [Flavobacterium columnare]